MAKKIVDNTPLTNFEDDWGGTYQSGKNAGKEWGKSHQVVETAIKAKVASLEAKNTQQDTAINGKVAGVIVNNSEVAMDGNGKVSLTVPTVDTELNDESANAVQNAAVTQKINGINSNLPTAGAIDPTREQDGMVPLVFSNSDGDTVFEAMIPAAQEIGEVISPKVTTTLLSASRVKLGDTIRMQWNYDCIRTVDGASESVNYPAQTVVVTVKVGTVTVHTETHVAVAVGTTRTLTLDSSVITQPGTVTIGVVATAQIEEETKTSRGSKTVTVITMDLASTFDPASQLALTNGYTDGQTVTIPYTYTVPAGTTLRVWVDGTLDSTATIGGTGRNYVYLNASELTAGRHNVQLIAESAGLLSNAVSVDFLKAGSTADYIGLRQAVDVSLLSDMPLAYAYGPTALPLSVAQFEEISLDVAAWNSTAIDSTIVVAVDGVTTQTLTADRTLQTVQQRFDTSGSHTMTITNGTATRTFAMTVTAAAGVTETETVGYRTKLTATGRSNSESNPANWGGITAFTGVDWRTNGWMRGSDGVDALLLTNGARAVVDVKPFVQDETDGDYSIQNRGMTLEMEVMLSHVMERGATLISCLYDNDGGGYPMGIKVTTEEAGLYFGGVEEITTAEDLVDENGNYIDYEGNIVDEEHKVKLKITRPHGISMNIAVDRWVHLAYIVQPVSSGYGLAMLFINGVLSRANRYTGSLRQTVPAAITFDSDKADIRVRNLRYYRTPLTADEMLGNWIIDRPTGLQIQTAHNNNAVGDANNTTDSDGNIVINHDTLISRGRGVLTIIRTTDTASDGAAAGSGTGLSELFRCTDKKQNFKADLVRWEPPLDSQGNAIGEGFEARNVRVRIQGTSSVKYPYKNFRIYLTTQQGSDARSLVIGGVDVTDTASGYPLRGSSNSIPQAVICAKTDFVDSSLTLNTGGAHLFNDVMHQLNLDTPPQQYDARVRQAIDGLPCDVYAGTSENGTLAYVGQFVLNNEKSKSSKIFGMDGVKDNGVDVDFRAYNDGTPVIDTKPIALEALTNSSPMTLFQAAGSADSAALEAQLAAEFDDGFEFNNPEDATWATIGTGDYADWGGAQTAIKRLMGWIYDCLAASAGVTGGTMTIASPDYGTAAGWSDASKAKWVSAKFKQEASQYFDMSHLLTYYLFTDYWASVDQRAKNILWRTWDGLKWYATYYDGDTAQSIRNDAFMVYLYNVTRDSYDTERSKYAFEGHSSWLWCLVLANFEDELKACAANLRNQLTVQVMLNEFNGVMQGNWSERQYNKSGKLKYIDTIDRMNYVYTLTGNRELHRTQFLTDRARLLDARYGAGNYNGDVITFTVVRQAADAQSSLALKSGDLYYFGYKLNGLWLQGPNRADAGETLTLTFTGTLATNDPLMLGGASCIKELDFTNMGSQLNGTVGLSLCAMLTKLVMPATNGVANAPLTLGNISKLEYIDITGQTAVHTGTAGVFDVSLHTRLTTLLAGNTSLTRIILPQGAPITTLTLPATLTTLTLRYLPQLRHSGLTLQGTTNITALNFAECPHLSWQTLLTQCQNIDHVRIEGMSGRVRSSALRPFMEGYNPTSATPTANMTYRGLTADGIEQTYPALLGTVQLMDDVDDFATLQSFFERCGLTVTAAEFTQYIFHDNITYAANLTNEDNLTGIAYGSTFAKSGHINKVHDKLRVGAYKMTNGVMKLIQELPRGAWTVTNGAVTLEDGTTFDLTDANQEGYDIFLYLPRYWYKGVNDFKNAKKHFLLSANDTCPASTAANTIRRALSQCSPQDGKVVATQTTGQPLALTTVSGYMVCQIPVEGMKQVRFPSTCNSGYGYAFTDEDGNVVASGTLTMNDVYESGALVSPIDFMAAEGDYDYRDVPETAVMCYFTCPNSIAETLEAIATDSAETEAVEPDWVEHKPELVGVYQGWAGSNRANMNNTTAPALFKLNGPLRSISGVYTLRGTTNGDNGTKGNWTYDSDGNPTAMPTNNCSGTATDFFNLARIRGEGFTTVNYETSKDLANLMMVWFGTRDVENVIGMGGTPAYLTGTKNAIGGVGDSVKSGTASANNTQQLNKAWGLEGWTGSVYEWMDGGCFNAPSFAQFLKDQRPTGSTSAPSSYPIDYYYHILQQDGTERKIKAATTNQRTGVARVRHGRYCDIIAGSYTGETNYNKCYFAFQSSGSNGSQVRKALVLGRSSLNANAGAGVVCVHSHLVSSSASTNLGARLCFFGEIENEEELSE